MDYPRLYTAEQTRQLDQTAIRDYGIPGYELMRRAGQCAFDLLGERWPDAKRIAVVCGVGNNGGDGYVVAELARKAGYKVTVLQLGDTAKQSDEARMAMQAMQASGQTLRPFDRHELEQADVIVDAIFGTGLTRDVSGEWLQAIAAINQIRAKRMSLDIPSGLHADTGAILGDAVCADVTTMFIGRKQGLYTGQARAYVGDLHFFDLNVPVDVYRQVEFNAIMLDKPRIQAVLGRRSPIAHKGDAGRALLIGGNSGMAGAIRLAAESCLRCGAGLTTVATRAAHAAIIAAQRPECMASGVETGEGIRALIGRTDVIAIGPGLGTDDWAMMMFEQVAASAKTVVMDADALNLLAKNPQHYDGWILTPHPGEAARLLGCDVAKIESDRFMAARAIQRQYGGVCVLKGAGSIVVGEQSPVYVCTLGNPGMATGGMGDVLTGILAALLAQSKNTKQSLVEIAAQAVALHAQAGDRAARDGERGMIASDLFVHLREGVNA